MNDYPPVEQEAIRFRKMNINEIENELSNEISSRLGWMFNALINAGRINGDGEKIINRIEEEIIRILREHWIK